jgi:hypothetical protein
VARSDLTVAIGSDGETTVGDATLVNVEALDVTDGTVRLDVGQDGVAGAVARLYTGTLGREGESAGLAYWIEQVDNGLAMGTIADFFAGSVEFANRFGTATTDAEFVDALYLNLRDQSGDAGGQAFWEGVLAGPADRGDLAMAFSQSGEAVANNADLLDEGVFLFG